MRLVKHGGLRAGRAEQHDERVALREQSEQSGWKCSQRLQVKRPTLMLKTVIIPSYDVIMNTPISNQSQHVL